ncbi:dephospho-CoA kinase domain-containing protein-like [Haliotis cracherodii]|uniref:dephospho-CoA kinase domain-containing protein-like n=1 Tax=Haliotis cracherodii TaxID=6455 RepID=UPI0039E7706C
MFLVGLTGGISTGKSTVSNKFRQLGCPVIDADKLAKDVVEPGKPAWYKIRETFGEDFFHDDGTLNRAKLGALIFSDGDKRQLLNSFTHPEIYKKMLWLLLKYFVLGYSFVVLDTPLLFESGKMVPYMTYTVVVSCSERQQLQRLMARNRLSRPDAESRICSQMALSEKCKRATYIIDNSGTVEMTEAQVVELHKKLHRSRAHWRIRTMLVMALVSTFFFLNYVYKRLYSGK